MTAFERHQEMMAQQTQSITLLVVITKGVDDGDTPVTIESMQVTLQEHTSLLTDVCLWSGGNTSCAGVWGEQSVETGRVCRSAESSYPSAMTQLGVDLIILLAFTHFSTVC